MTRRKNMPTFEGKQAKIRSFVKSEWPLFFYPALVVAAIVLLQMADRSIREDLTVVQEQQSPHAAETTPAIEQNHRQVSETAIEGFESGLPGDAISPVSGEVTAPDGDPEADRLRMIEALRQRAASATGDSLALGGEAQEPQGVNGLLTGLREAVRTQDHSRIKQAMNDLVALGDEAVGPLVDLVASGTDETALWAAEALARIGTPTATAALLDTLSQIKDGPYKEQIAKTASNITNHDSWPLLLDALQDTKDATVQRAAAASLSKMADTPVLDEIIARYDAALTEEDAARLAQLVSNISSPSANASLRALADSVSSAASDSLQQAAIDALANVADAQSVSFLLNKLEAASPGDGSGLFNTITSISSPQAHSALMYAAAGSKDVSAEQGRTAAIYALENYPSVETCVLLEQIIAREDNTAVITAALRTLENIQKAVPSAVEKATSKADAGTLLSVDPLQK